ncbi:hypothetical protein H9P43_005740 [Blastocladiella emersonii ATCC 22665]|nr:hypothetical protein H9P43_005740 [Blastocladiella emersonii ATCC 22665]
MSDPKPKVTLDDLPLVALENILARCTPRDVLAVSRLSRKWRTMLSSADEELWNGLLRAHASRFAHVVLARARRLQLDTVTPRDLYFATVCRAEIHAWGQMACEVEWRNPGHVPVALDAPDGVREPITQIAMGGKALYVVYGDGTLAVLGRVLEYAGRRRDELTVIRRDVHRVVPARYGVAILTKAGKWVRSEVRNNEQQEEKEYRPRWTGHQEESSDEEEEDDELGPASLVVGSGWEWIVTYDAKTKNLVASRNGTEVKCTFPHPGVRFVGNTEDDVVVATATHVYQRAIHPAAESDPWRELFAVTTTGPREAIVELNCFYRTIGLRTTRRALFLEPGNPVPRELPAGVCSLATGDWHHGFITDDGSVYTWGAYSDGANGRERGAVKEPEPMACFEQDRSKAVIHLAMGGWSSVALVVPLGPVS